MPEAKPTPRTPRVIDPEILKIRADTKAKVEAYRAQQKSADILKRITDNDLPKMTAIDLGILSKSVTEQISKKPF